MARRTPALAAALAVLALSACQKDGGGADSARLEALDRKLTELDDRLDKLEGFLRPYLDQPPPPPEPDPAATYAVPVEGAPYEGPAHAQVTIIEAFEFS
jgi:hypothetical protein